MKDFKTFRALAEGEVLPEGYIKIPYHIVYDVKFDGRHKARLVMGGHRTPDVPDSEVYSGVVSMDTIRTAFVIAATNNLQVCAADVSTAFLHGKTREKVDFIAGAEFGEDAGKVMIVEGILILTNPELRDLFDIKIFVHADSDERLIRRLKRDISERGRDIDEVLNRYQTTLKPMHEQFIEPTKAYADLIIPNNKYNTVAIDIVKTIISERL